MAPKRIFIVPYKNRKQQKFFFCRQMDFNLEGETDYEIYFSHQMDSRAFNRGAMKNIGFLAMKKKYPDDYLDITFIFNDVDTIPFHKIFDYQTTHGVVQHYYGYECALGGIVVFKGADFERVNGYPNLWGWGLEDNIIQSRCKNHGIKIDRTNFYPLGSPEILQLFEGIIRLVNKNDTKRMANDDGSNGLTGINKLIFRINKESTEPEDNKYFVNNEKIFYINVSTFITPINYNTELFHTYDLREPQKQVYNPDNSKTFIRGAEMSQDLTKDSLANIPENVAKYTPTVAKKFMNFGNYKFVRMGLGGIK